MLINKIKNHGPPSTQNYKLVSLSIIRAKPFTMKFIPQFIIDCQNVVFISSNKHAAGNTGLASSLQQAINMIRFGLIDELVKYVVYLRNFSNRVILWHSYI
jgi:hypothetical protein